MSFPGNFPGELFWWKADSSFDTTSASGRAVSARLVLGEEATFLNGDAAPGDQIAFGRIRIRIDGLTLGQTYHVTTPYLVRDFVATDDGKGGGEINYTEDLGCLQAPCDFNRVNQSNIGPFLRQVGAPKGYLGDPNVSAPITGAPNGFNEFAISGPDVTGQSDLFAVSGKELAGGPVGTGQLSASSTTARVTAGQPATITLTNIGTAPATPQVSLPAGSGFTITSNGCATPVAPGASCTVTIGLNGARPGATVDLQVTNGTQPPITITVQRPGGGNAAPTAPALTAASDTGISAVDGLTNLGTVTVSGAAATGQPVQVLVDGAPVTTVNAVAGTFSVPLTLTEGAHKVTAAYVGQPSSAPVTVTVDTTAPAVSAPRVSTDVATGPLNGSVVWSGPGTAAFTAQVRRNDGAFTAVTLPGANTTRVQQQLVSGDRYRFRVRGTDAAGNVSAWAGTTVQSSLVQERSAAVRYDGRWARHSVATASGQRVAFSAQRGATATLRTRAQTVKVIAPTGPRRGRAAVLVNGARVRTVDLYSSAPRRRQTVAVLNGLARPKVSVVQVRVLGSKRRASNGTGVALDAFLTNR
jgi:hypothetical protein